MDSFPKAILATNDFQKTIVKTKVPGSCMDSYQRAVQWVLTDRQRDGSVTTMIIISPYEANGLIPLIEASEHVVLRESPLKQGWKDDKSCDRNLVFRMPHVVGLEGQRK